MTFEVPRGGASSKSQGGQKAQFAPNFRKIRFLLHFYVTIFWIFQNQGGQLTPLTPSYDAPDEFTSFYNVDFNVREALNENSDKSRGVVTGGSRGAAAPPDF